MKNGSDGGTSVKYGVQAIPTILLFQKGEVTKKFVGLTSKKTFKEALDGIAN